MITYKTVIFSMTVLILAINIPLLMRSDPGSTMHVNWFPESCDWNPTGWQCANTLQWMKCQENEQCVIQHGLAI